MVASAAVSASTSAPPTPNSKAPTESASIQRDDRSKTSDQDVIPLASALASTQSEVSASKAEEPLTHSAPQASVDYRTAMAYVKTHWPEIQDAVRAHFDNEANYAYYAHLTQARTIGENKLHKVSFYEVLSRIDNSVELVVLLQGSTPGSGFGFVHLSFNRYLRYRLLRQGDRFIVVEFRQATHSDMVTSLQ